MPVFTPEEKKIFDQEVESVKKGMLDNKRALVSKYGKDAEKVIQGNAVKKALKKIENLRKDQEMENNKLKEMVKAALTKPLKEQDVEVRADRIKGETELSEIMNLLDNFESALKFHDWYYMMSDDPKSYTIGVSEEGNLKGMASQLDDKGYGKEAEELYNKYNIIKHVSFEDFISSLKSLPRKKELHEEDLDLGDKKNTQKPSEEQVLQTIFDCVSIRGIDLEDYKLNFTNEQSGLYDALTKLFVDNNEKIEEKQIVSNKNFKRVAEELAKKLKNK